MYYAHLNMTATSHLPSHLTLSPGCLDEDLDEVETPFSIPSNEQGFLDEGLTGYHDETSTQRPTPFSNISHARKSKRTLRSSLLSPGILDSGLDGLHSGYASTDEPPSFSQKVLHSIYNNVTESEYQNLFEGTPSNRSKYRRLNTLSNSVHDGSITASSPSLHNSNHVLSTNIQHNTENNNETNCTLVHTQNAELTGIHPQSPPSTQNRTSVQSSSPTVALGLPVSVPPTLLSSPTANIQGQPSSSKTITTAANDASSENHINLTPIHQTPSSCKQNNRNQQSPSADPSRLCQKISSRKYLLSASSPLVTQSVPRSRKASARMRVPTLQRLPTPGTSLLYRVRRPLISRNNPTNSNSASEIEFTTSESDTEYPVSSIQSACYLSEAELTDTKTDHYGYLNNNILRSGSSRRRQRLSTLLGYDLDNYDHEADDITDSLLLHRSLLSPNISFRRQREQFPFWQSNLQDGSYGPHREELYWKRGSSRRDAMEREATYRSLIRGAPPARAHRHISPMSMKRWEMEADTSLYNNDYEVKSWKNPPGMYQETRPNRPPSYKEDHELSNLSVKHIRISPRLNPDTYYPHMQKEIPIKSPLLPAFCSRRHHISQEGQNNAIENSNFHEPVGINKKNHTNGHLKDVQTQNYDQILHQTAHSPNLYQQEGHQQSSFRTQGKPQVISISANECFTEQDQDEFETHSYLGGNPKSNEFKSNSEMRAKQKSFHQCYKSLENSDYFERNTQGKRSSSGTIWNHNVSSSCSPPHDSLKHLDYSLPHADAQKKHIALRSAGRHFSPNHVEQRTPDTTRSKISATNHRALNNVENLSNDTRRELQRSTPPTPDVHLASRRKAERGSQKQIENQYEEPSFASGNELLLSGSDGRRISLGLTDDGSFDDHEYNYRDDNDHEDENTQEGGTSFVHSEDTAGSNLQPIVFQDDEEDPSVTPKVVQKSSHSVRLSTAPALQRLSVGLLSSPSQRSYKSGQTEVSLKRAIIPFTGSKSYSRHKEKDGNENNKFDHCESFSDTCYDGLDNEADPGIYQKESRNSLMLIDHENKDNHHRLSVASFACQVDAVGFEDNEYGQLVPVTKDTQISRIQSKNKSQKNRLIALSERGQRIFAKDVKYPAPKLVSLDEADEMFRKSHGILAANDEEQNGPNQIKRKYPRRHRCPPLRTWCGERHEFAYDEELGAVVPIGIYLRDIPQSHLDTNNAFRRKKQGESKKKERPKQSISSKKNKTKMLPEARLSIEAPSSSAIVVKTGEKSFRKNKTTPGYTKSSKSSNQLRRKKPNILFSSDSESDVIENNQTLQISQKEVHDTDYRTSDNFSEDPIINEENKQPIIYHKEDLKYVPIETPTGPFEVAIMHSRPTWDQCRVIFYSMRSKGVEIAKTPIVGLIMQTDHHKCLITIGENVSKLSLKQASQQALKFKKRESQIAERTEEICWLLSQGDVFYIPPNVYYNIANISK